MRRITTLVVCTLALTLCAGAAFAASTTYTDVMKVDYFINANTAGAPDEVLQLTNTGYSGGYVCADIFVFDPYQEMQECCSCTLSPNDLRTLSVNSNLTGNPLTDVTNTTGSIRVVSAEETSGYCPTPYKDITPVSYTVRTWSTHIQNVSSDTYSITETAGQDATLSSSELTALTNGCYAIHLDGSGHGICTCGSGE